MREGSKTTRYPAARTRYSSSLSSDERAGVPGPNSSANGPTAANAARRTIMLADTPALAARLAGDTLPDWKRRSSLWRPKPPWRSKSRCAGSESSHGPT